MNNMELLGAQKFALRDLLKRRGLDTFDSQLAIEVGA